MQGTLKRIALLGSALVVACLCGPAATASAAAPYLLPGTFGGAEGSLVGSGQLTEPRDIALAPNGALYAVEGEDATIKRFSSSGVAEISWGNAAGPGQLVAPQGVAVSPAADVYVIDLNEGVKRYDADGNYVSGWGTSGSADGQFNAPQGIAVGGPSMHVYVADTGNDRIQEFDSAGGFIRAFGTAGSGDGELDDPRDVAVDAAGNVAVADGENARVQIFDSSGSFVTKWGSSGSSAGQFEFLRDIAFDRAGNVYALDDAGLQKFDATGVYLGGLAYQPVLGVAVAPDGRVHVVRFDAGRSVDTFGPTPIAYAEGDGPVAVDPLIDVSDDDDANLTGATVEITAGFHPQDVLGYARQVSITGVTVTYVGDTLTFTGTATVAQYETLLRTVKFLPGNDPGSATRTITLTVSNADSSNSVSRAINVAPTDDAPALAPGTTGAFVRKWGQAGSGNGDLQLPTGIGADGAGNVFVVDANNNRVQLFDATGTYVRQWPTSALGGAVDGLGHFYTGSNSVFKYDASGTQLTTWPAGANTAQALAADRAGNVYVADSGLNRVAKFDSSGNTVKRWGSTGSGTGQFNAPRGIAVDETGNVYVSDFNNNRIQKFDSSGTFLTQWTGFNGPRALAVDGAGFVYLSNATANQVLKLDPVSGATLASWGSAGTADGQFNAPRGLSVDPGGNVYVSDSGNNRIQKFGPTTLSFTEGDVPLAVDPGLHLADPDSTQLSGATITIAGGSSEDELLFSDQNGISGSYASGTLTLTGGATLADYRTALRSVRFDTGEDPGAATRTISFTAKSGSAVSAAVPRRLAVTPVNDSPAAGTSSGSTSEDAPATAAAPGVLSAASDVDSGALTVDRVEGSAANVGEVFTTPRGAKLTIASSGALTYDPNGQFESLATGATDSESFSYRVSDGSGGTDTGTLTVTITGVDDAPAVAPTGGALGYTENAAPTAIDQALGLTDVDDSDLTGATVQLTNPQPGDRLAYATTSGVAGSVNGAGDTVTLTGTHTVAAYRAAMRAVTYDSTSDTPATVTRTVDFIADDGETTGHATRTIALTAVDDAPVPTADSRTTGEDTPLADAAPGVLANDTDVDSPSMTVDQVAGSAANVGQPVTTAKGAKVTIAAGGALTYDPNGRFESLGGGQTATDSVDYGIAGASTPVTATITITGADDAPTVFAGAAPAAYTENAAPVAIDPGVAIADVDDASLESATVTLLDAQPGDRLAYATTNGVAGSVSGNVVTLSGAGDVADYQAALRAVTYDSTSEDPSTATRSVAFRAGDGELDSPVATQSIAVTATPEPAAPGPGSTSPGPTAPGPTGPGPSQPAPLAAATIAGQTIRVDKKGRAAFVFACSGAQCKGKLKLVTVKKWGGKRLTLANATFDVAPGRRTIKLKLTSTGRKLLTRQRSLKVVASIALGTKSVQRTLTVTRR